jgi:hypothetical protein
MSGSSSTSWAPSWPRWRAHRPCWFSRRATARLDRSVGDRRRRRDGGVPHRLPDRRAHRRAPDHPVLGVRQPQPRDDVRLAVHGGRRDADSDGDHRALRAGRDGVLRASGGRRLPAIRRGVWPGHRAGHACRPCHRAALVDHRLRDAGARGHVVRLHAGPVDLVLPRLRRADRGKRLRNWRDLGDPAAVCRCRRRAARDRSGVGDPVDGVQPRWPTGAWWSSRRCRRRARSTSAARPDPSRR